MVHVIKSLYCMFMLVAKLIAYSSSYCVIYGMENEQRLITTSHENLNGLRNTFCPLFLSPIFAHTCITTTSNLQFWWLAIGGLNNYPWCGLSKCVHTCNDYVKVACGSVTIDAFCRAGNLGNPYWESSSRLWITIDMWNITGIICCCWVGPSSNCR